MRSLKVLAVNAIVRSGQNIHQYTDDLVLDIHIPIKHPVLELIGEYGHKMTISLNDGYFVQSSLHSISEHGDFETMSAHLHKFMYDHSNIPVTATLDQELIFLYQTGPGLIGPLLSILENLHWL